MTNFLLTNIQGVHQRLLHALILKVRYDANIKLFQHLFGSQ